MGREWTIRVGEEAMWELAEALTARGTGTALTLRNTLLARVVETETTALARSEPRPSPAGPSDAASRQRRGSPTWGHDT